MQSHYDQKRAIVPEFYLFELHFTVIPQISDVLYVRYSVSYRDLEEIMAERGVSVDHATLNRWVIRYSPHIAEEAKKRKQLVAGSWRMDETYIKVKGQWTYLYRAIDRYGNTVDFMLTEHRDEASCYGFL